MPGTNKFSLPSYYLESSCDLVEVCVGSTDRDILIKLRLFPQGQDRNLHHMPNRFFFNGGFSGHIITGNCSCLEFMRTSLHFLGFLRAPGIVFC